jgi:hypothetical protein
MKKLLFTLLTLLFLTPLAKAEDAGLWDNFGDINIYQSDEQTAVSDEQFNKTVDTVKEKQKKRGLFAPKEPKKMKGKSYQESNETEFLNNIKIETPILRIPYELQTTSGTTIPIGHYQTVFEKDNNGFMTMKLYQAHTLIAQLPAQETEEDLFDEHINYLTLEDFGETKIKINYGSIDFNAFAIIDKK